MTLLRIDARGGRPVDANGRAARGAVQHALGALPEDRPVVIMVHGYKFCPDVTGRDPHRHILAMRPLCRDARAISWPAHLGFRRRDAGLAIAFGWDSRGSIWRAAGAARAAAEALAMLIRMIGSERRAPVHLVAHSLGARVVLRAMCSVPIGSVGKVILMAGAAFQGEAEAALASPAGRSAEVINVSSRENTLFDLLLAGSLRGFAPGSRSVARGLMRLSPNWVDLSIDRANTRAALGRLGFRIAPPARRVCHWSAYLRPGMFPLYRALIEGRMDIGTLARCARVPRSRLWHRLLPFWLQGPC